MQNFQQIQHSRGVTLSPGPVTVLGPGRAGHGRAWRAAGSLSESPWSGQLTTGRRHEPASDA